MRVLLILNVCLPSADTVVHNYSCFCLFVQLSVVVCNNIVLCLMLLVMHVRFFVLFLCVYCLILLPRDAMHMLGLCHHAVSVCLYVRPSRSWIM